MNFTILPRHRAATSASAPQTGSALIVTLAFIVLLTALMLAFLSRSGINQRIAGASADDSKADLIAKTGLDVVVGDFRQEIAAGSSVTANTTAFPSWPIYLPLNASNTAPARILTIPEGANEPNLIRRSMASAEFLTNAVNLNPTYTGFPENNLASADSSANPAASGRSVVASRWNKPGLLTNTTASTFVAPDWVLVTRNGPKAFTAWDATVKDSSPANTNYVVGRYAYNVYNEGGLLDANVVGRYASAGNSIPTPPLGKAAVAGLADLTQLTNGAAGCVPNQTAVNNLVAYRNASTTTTVYNSTTPSDPTTYFGYLTGSTNSFTKVRPGDAAFLTRQDLINYLASGASGITTNALPYLGTFTRQVNAPSFYPALTNFKNTLVANATATDRPVINGSLVPATDKSEAGRLYAGQDSNVNPPLADVRFPTTSTLPDGTQVTAGEPMLRKKFALSRLALLTLTATCAASDGNSTTAGSDLIYRYFGLSRSDNTKPWVYNHGTTDGSIFTLPKLQAAIAAGTVSARDPDFFELLQASIAVGSLGRDAGAPITGSQDLDFNPPAGFTVASPGPYVNGIAQSVTQHILQIGANIVDQANPKPNPLVIQFVKNGTTYSVYGVEDMPYINRVFHFVCKDTSKSSANAWYIFELWNPFQVTSNTPAVTYRICGMSPSGGQSQVHVDLKILPPGNTHLYSPTMDFNQVDATGQPMNYLQFTPVSTSSFANPTILTPADTPTVANATFTADPNSPNNLFSQSVAGNAHSWAGLYLGNVADAAFTSSTTFTQTTVRPGSVVGTNSTGHPAATETAGYVTLNLQYLVPGTTSQWQTYCLLENIYATKPINGDPAAYYTSGGISYKRLDPRTDRFTTYVDDVAPSLNRTLSPSQGSFSDPYTYMPLQACGFSQVETTAKHIGEISLNNENGGPTAGYAPYYYYNDADGVVRRGDDMYQNATGDSSGVYGYSMNLTPTSPYLSRPIMLHRPFQSVGELGYAFRDVPFKSIDFFTSRSGDSALLDVFSAYEEPSVVAGKIDVNTLNAPVLSALIAGAAIDELGSSSGTTTGISTISAYNAATITSLSKLLVRATSASPFHNKSDLVNRLNGNALWNDTGATPGSPATTLEWGQGYIAAGTLARVQEQRIKSNRESALRSLSEATASRTWNLLIDIIAQSGRYAPTANGLQNFTIGGEKRYWLHVAIDRYTGKIIDEQLEPVYE